MVRHAPIHRRSGYSDIAICCGRNVRGSSPSTSVVPLSNQVTTLNHKRFKGFKMFSDGHLEHVPFMWNQRLASLPGLTRLDPAIHPTSKDFLRGRWMRGSSPRMTPCQEILTLKVMLHGAR